jgi:hypothetical protein
VEFHAETPVRFSGTSPNDGANWTLDASAPEALKYANAERLPILPTADSATDACAETDELSSPSAGTGAPSTYTVEALVRFA